MDDQVLCLFLSSRSPPSGSWTRDLKDDGSLSDSRAGGAETGTRRVGRGDEVGRVFLEAWGEGKGLAGYDRAWGRGRGGS
ncbi:hypothetical protein E2C01_092966 [Portunus trituberculatus]|uniref:Uncharacterized protein n=1 Tax=Portunus trituberculatus TaxID=210409 RepID=A0A5B7JNL1_PORTR|nr:hypothetical protein [Portunus trituberculatus]